MGYALLWMVALGGELLLLATLMACIGRLRWPRIRVALSVLVALTSLSACLALIGVVEWAKSERFVSVDFGRPMWFLTLFYAIGASWMLFRGLRPSRQRPETPGAATWPRGRLAVALTVSLALYMMTTWNLDVAVQQRVAALRVEAGALAASVAPVRVPHRDNAAMIYQQAFELMAPLESWDRRWTDWFRNGSPELDPKDAKLREFLEGQAATLRLLRQASEKPDCCFEHDYAHPDILIALPELGSIRTASRLLALDARSNAAAGDLRTALADVNAMFVMAEHAGTEPLLVGVVSSAAMNQSAFTTLEAVLASKEASADELTLLDISDTFSYQRLFNRALQMEEAFAIATYCDYGARFRVAELNGSGPRPWEEKHFGPFYRIFAFEDDLASYREILRESHKRSGKPHYESLPEWRAAQDAPDASMRGIVAQSLIPAVYPVAERTAEADARWRLARLAVAASRYRATENQLPDSLGDLVPAWLPAVPLDPFDGNRLSMALTDQELVLYSVGPDGADDGGAPYDVQERTGDVRFAISKPSATTEENSPENSDPGTDGS